MIVKSFRYLENGELDSQQSFETDGLDAIAVDRFSNDLKSLSGDFELPLERTVPNFEHGAYRIVSDLNSGALVLYYFHDELILASLILARNADQADIELMQIFRYLLLEPEDAAPTAAPSTELEDDPTDDQIDAVLELEGFNFESVSDRPVVFSVVYELEPHAPEVTQQLEDRNEQVAAAFFRLIGRS